MSSEARILIVEDEPELAAGIAENLAAEGYVPEVAPDGQAGLDAARRREHELVILDVMLPRKDGFAVCRQLRAEGNEVPVLFLTAKSDPRDRIRGFEDGADDYMSKPFHLAELLLRVAAILRRNRWYKRSTLDRPVIHFGGNEVDFRTYRGRSADGTEHELTHKEALILRLLAEREGEVVSRDEILDVVWGYEAFPSSRTIDNFILRLRRRFEQDPRAPRYFHTVHGVGYRFTSDDDDR
ncbi:MAG: response regulator transcription factor [Acidobacteria bacterium]|nr:response regulator transcription factor [Acidobacteriota bacterium]